MSWFEKLLPKVSTAKKKGFPKAFGASAIFVRPPVQS